MHRVPRYRPKYVKFCWFDLEGRFWKRFGRYFSTWGVFFKTNFWRLNRDSKPVVLNTMNPIIKTNFFSLIKGSEILLKLRVPKRSHLKNDKSKVFHILYIDMNGNQGRQYLVLYFFNFQPTLLNTPYAHFFCLIFYF